ncbi:hypothetical protein [Merismopedia glauca]|uniref:Uncharacterized protein n=1 Tax=Merismopedia glauca CCAP 1448/3 TaxID=1296344 RepID=A0A2T1C8B1_9CYAN|nr:hypothetical protein [Merismopedia glauca]PSB04496.1 hypothetical protein C7B64_03495 [Merismopedia glauca CCAP 1448/3]
MIYGVPGFADALPEAVVSAWNQQIKSEFNGQSQNFGSRFMVLDPASIPNSQTTDAVKWAGSPAEPEFCQNVDIARQLSDFGDRARQILHNEYLEYHITYRSDDLGRLRPKRVEVTTELREYWVTLAVNAPEQMQAIAQEILGRPIPFSEFYGPGVTDPNALSPQQRENLFSQFVAGDGKGTSAVGRLNLDNALFMGHPINGLDDLIYIVMFGAIPRQVKVNGNFRKAELYEIFRQAGTTYLACRHADPAAAAAAHDAASEGRTVAFANPLGMYIRTFTADNFFLNEEPIPQNWIKFSRGNPGLYQRLEFGPSDAEPFFLDDIKIIEGADERQITGGYDVVAKVEVGPIVVVGESTPIEDNEYRTIPSEEPINCREANVCRQIQQLKDELDSQAQFIKVSPRRMRLE